MKSLGYVSVTTPGTLVRLTVNEPTPSDRVAAQLIHITPLPGNDAIVYVGRAGFDRTTGVGVVGIIPVPASATQGPFAPVVFRLPLTTGGFNLADLWIDAGTGSNGVNISYA